MRHPHVLENQPNPASALASATNRFLSAGAAAAGGATTDGAGGAFDASTGPISAFLPKWGPRIHLSPDDPPAPAPAPSPAPAPAPAPAPSPAPAPAPAPAPGPSASYRPEGLPDHWAGKSDKETIDILFKTANGFRTQQSAAGTVPEKPDGYKFEASEKLAPYTQNFAKDPVWGKTLEFAHKAGLTDKAFNAFMGPLLENLVEGGLVAAPVDAKAMLRDLAPAGSYADDAAKEAAGGKRVTDNIAWADGAKANKSIDPDIAGFLAASAADNPAANKLIEWLRGSNGETLPAMGGASGSGLSDAQLKDRINDERNNPSSSKFDKAFAKETDELSKKHWG